MQGKLFQKIGRQERLHFCLSCSLVAMFCLVTLQPADDNDLNVVNLVLGYLGGIVSSVVSFYFGASKGGK